MTALTHYDEIFLQLSSDYSKDASLLSPYATDDEVDHIRAFQDRLQANGQRLVGTLSYRNEQIQEHDPDSGRLVLLTCLNFTGTRLIDSAGGDVTPPERQPEDSIRIDFEIRPDGLRVGESAVWTGTSVC